MHLSNNGLFPFRYKLFDVKTSALSLLLRLSVAFLLVSCDEIAKLAQQADASHDELAYEVLKVSDGDTMQMLDTRTKEKVKVRLFGVDAPEKKQAYGLQSKDFSTKMLLGKKVNLRPRAKDQYGRMVAEILLADGTNFNEELLRNGCAWHYKQYSKDPKWAALEDQARAEKVGLWAGKRPTPPWDYRKKERIGRGNRNRGNDNNPPRINNNNNLVPEDAQNNNPNNPKEESELEEDLILQPLVN